MKNAKKYFEKNGFIFGNSYKFEFGKYSNHITEFKNFEEAEKWLHTEEADFRTREFISKTEAMKILSNASKQQGAERLLPFGAERGTYGLQNIFKPCC